MVAEEEMHQVLVGGCLRPSGARNGQGKWTAWGMYEPDGRAKLVIGLRG